LKKRRFPFIAGNCGTFIWYVPGEINAIQGEPADYDWDFHNAPQRQFIILLKGIIEITTSDGESRIFSGGDIQEKAIKNVTLRKDYANQFLFNYKVKQ
jgi:hypothetical protein